MDLDICRLMRRSSPYNWYDHESLVLMCSHNVGAGGVSVRGYTHFGSNKRYMQQMLRIERATGDSLGLLKYYRSILDENVRS